MFNGIRFTREGEIQSILETGFRILEEIGICIENQELIRLIQEKFPGQVTEKKGRLCFSSNLCWETFLSGQNKAGLRAPTASCRGEVYEGFYLDPLDGQYKEWNEERLLSYFKLAKSLPDVDGIGMLGCPLHQLNLDLQPLYEKLYCFKYGVSAGGAVWDSALCGPLLELFEIYASEKRKPVDQVFSGCVYLLTPLKFGYVEAEQLMWFYHHGVRLGVGVLASLGLSVPVTLAGGLAEQLAEQVFIGIVNRTLFDETCFCLSSMLSGADLRSGMFQYGRPEQVMMNNALSEIADYYHMPFSAHGGLSDAKTPGYEAGIQKMATAMANLSKGRDGYLAGGLLSVDELCSPVQLVLDSEAAAYLKHICKGFSVEEETLAFDCVRECIEENMMFLETEHTLSHWKESLWTPSVFSSNMFAEWSKEKRRETGLAREKALSLMWGALESEISEDCEKRLREVIRRAETGR